MIAEQARADLEYELNHGLDDPAGISWDAFRERFHQEHLTGLRQRSREKASDVLDTFGRAMRPSRLADVDESMVSRFAQWMLTNDYRPWTRRNYLGAVKAAMRWADGQRLVRCPRFPTIRVPRLKPKPVPTELAERLIDATTDPQLRAFLLCGLLAGLRRQEAFDLRRRPSEQFAWVDWESSLIVLPAAAGKSNEDAALPLHPHLAATLAALPVDDADRIFCWRDLGRGRNSRPVTVHAIRHRIQEAAHRAGVRLSMHDLRRCFGSRLARAHAPAVVRAAMRHSSIATTMQFYANVDSELRGAIDGLDAGELVIRRGASRVKALKIKPVSAGKIRRKVK